MTQEGGARKPLYIFEPITAFNLPRNDLGHVEQDIYIYLPIPRKYIVFLNSGEKFTYAKQSALKKHVIPVLFLKRSIDDLDEDQIKAQSSDTKPEVLKNQNVQAENQKTIDDICNELFNSSEEKPDQAIKRFEKLGDDILKVVAPEVQNFKKSILENVNYLWLMNDASAISTLATLFCTANEIGIDTKKPIRDIVFACLIMDFPLAGLGQDKMNQYYLDPKKLSEGDQELVKNHPIEAYKMASRKLNSFSDGSLELILHHHELYNGTGYPKNIRNGSIFPVAQILSLAVDAFEHLKRGQLTGTNENLREILMKLKEIDVEPHLKRHNSKWINNVISYLELGIPE